MRNLKKVLALVLALVMTMSLVTIANAAEFSDADDIQYTEAVDVLTSLGVIEGVGNNTYNPKGNVTRAQMAKMITIVALGNVEPSAFLGTTTDLKDINGHWAEAYIKYCYSQGIISGRGNGIFDPNDNVTCAEASKMLLTAIGYNSNVQGYTGAQWTINVARDAQTSGFYEDLSVPAAQALTRDQAAQLIYNAVQAPIIEKRSNVDRDDGTITDNYIPNENKSLLSETFKAKIFIGSFNGNYNTGNTAGLKDAISVTGWLTTEDYTSNRTATFLSDLDISNIGEEVKVLFKDGTSGTSGTPDKNDTIYGVFNTNSTTVYTITKDQLQDAKTEVSNGKIKFGDVLYTVANLNTADYASGYYAIVNNYGASSVSSDLLDGTSDSDKATAVEFATYINTPANGLRVTSTDPIKFVCNDKGEIEKVYVLNTITSELTAKTDTNIQLAGQTSKKVENCVGFDNISVGEMVRFANLYPTSTALTTVIEKSQLVEGTITAYNATGNAVEIDGTWYKYNGHNSFVNSNYTSAALANTNVGDTVSLILDGGKYYGAYKVISGFNDYAMVTWAGTNMGTDTVRALLADGTDSTYANIGVADGGIALPSVSANDNSASGAILYAYDLESNNTKIKLNAPTGYTLNTGDRASGNVHSFNAKNMVLTIVGQGADTTSTQIVSTDAVVFLYDLSAAKWKTYSAKDLDSFNMTDATRLQYIVKDGRVVAFAGSVSNAPTSGVDSTSFGYVVDRIDTKVNDSNVTLLKIWNGTEEVSVYVDGRSTTAYKGDFVQYPVAAEGAVVAPSDVKVEVTGGTSAGSLNFITTKLKSYDTANHLLITTNEIIGSDGKAVPGTDRSFLLPDGVQIIGVDSANKASSTVNTPVKYNMVYGADYNNVVVAYTVNAAGYNEVKAIFVDENGRMYNYTSGGSTGTSTGQGTAIAIPDNATPITTLGGSGSSKGTVAVSATSDKATAAQGETVTVTVTVSGSTTSGAGYITIGGVTSANTTVSGNVSKVSNSIIKLANAGDSTGTVTFTYTMGSSYVAPTFTYADCVTVTNLSSTSFNTGATVEISSSVAQAAVGETVSFTLTLGGTSTGTTSKSITATGLTLTSGTLTGTSVSGVTSVAISGSTITITPESSAIAGTYTFTGVVTGAASFSAA